MRDHEDITATRDGVVARVLGERASIDDAVTLLDRAEAAGAVPLVDEAERHRLKELAQGTPRPGHWHPVLARRGEVAVGYAGVVLPPTPGLDAVGDLAVVRDAGPCGPVLAALLASLERLAWRHDAGHLQVWIRRATADDLTCATDEGYGVDRQLAVLGRPLPAADGPPVTTPGVHIRTSQPDVDDAAIVAVLAAAYAHTPEAGWDLARFRDRRQLGWFRHEDLLVAHDDTGRILGVHWLKRRSPTVGEVYNLAVHPDAQARRLGAVLLDAGLRHLTAIGCDEVVLWVDRANEPAIRLYISQGFTTLWEDVALGRTLRGSVADP